MSEEIDLPDEFRKIMNQELNQVRENADSEAVFILYKTDWVRIIVVRQLDSSLPVAIDVEVSPPFHSSSSNVNSISHIKKTTTESKLLLESMIEHIKYILALETSGFSVDLVGDGCLMIAYSEFQDIPDAEIFQLLLPPSV
ncbi:MAG: hypothetical protein RTV72_11400 [Candidatus Thorarchaeota archaeon]